MSVIVKALENLYNNSVSRVRADDRGLRFIERVLSHLSPDTENVEELKVAYQQAIDQTRRDGERAYSWGLMAVGRILGNV